MQYNNNSKNRHATRYSTQRIYKSHLAKISLDSLTSSSKSKQISLHHKTNDAFLNKVSFQLYQAYGSHICKNKRHNNITPDKAYAKINKKASTSLRAQSCLRGSYRPIKNKKLSSNNNSNNSISNNNKQQGNIPIYEATHQSLAGFTPKSRSTTEREKERKGLKGTKMSQISKQEGNVLLNLCNDPESSVGDYMSAGIEAKKSVTIARIPEANTAKNKNSNSVQLRGQSSCYQQSNDYESNTLELSIETLNNFSINPKRKKRHLTEKESDSVEDIHCYFVKFYQKSKKMLTKVENNTDLNNEKEGDYKKTIQSISINC